MAWLTAKLVAVLARSWRAFRGLSPYVIGGVVAGEALKLTRVEGMVRRGCERSLPIAILLAALLGIVSPLCTYGTVPLIVQLLAGGVPLAPLVTFLSTSSLMNPQLFVMTLGGLGAGMALARVAAVAAFGLVFGLAVRSLPSAWVVSSRAAVAGVEAGGRHGSGHDDERPSAWRRLARGIPASLEFVGFYFVAGVLLGAVVEVFVPEAFMSRVFQRGGFTSLLIATALGVPLYACGGGAIPLVRSAMKQGMPRGAALSFLIIGPATRVTPIASLAAVMKPAFVLGYVSAAFVFSMLAGALYH